MPLILSKHARGDKLSTLQGTEEALQYLRGGYNTEDFFLRAFTVFCRGWVCERFSSGNCSGLFLMPELVREKVILVLPAIIHYSSGEKKSKYVQDTYESAAVFHTTMYYPLGENKPNVCSRHLSIAAFHATVYYALLSRGREAKSMFKIHICCCPHQMKPNVQDIALVSS